MTTTTISIPSLKHFSQIFLHGSKLDELLEFIDKDVLPEEYGGTGPPLTGKVTDES